MIKINLLGDETVRDHRGPLLLAVFGASFVVLLLICFFVYRSVSTSVFDTTNELQQAEIRLAKLKEKTKEVRDLEARRDELQKITLAIATLKKNQEGPVRLLDDVNGSVPNRAWLTTLEVKSGAVKLIGFALSDGALVTLMKQLEQSKYFDRLDLTDRLAVPLSQITTYNSFDGVYNRYVVRGEVPMINSKMAELEKEAKAMGLLFFKGQPGLGMSRESTGTNNPTGSTKDPIKKAPPARSGVLTRGSQFTGKPMLYAWASLEKVDGILFTLDGRVRYTPRLGDDALSLDAPAAGSKPAGAPGGMPGMPAGMPPGMPAPGMPPVMPGVQMPGGAP